jgi:hypothetical protein
MAPLFLALHPVLLSGPEQSGISLLARTFPALVRAVRRTDHLSECEFTWFALPIRKCKELKEAARLLLQGLVMAVALCAGEAHAEDAGAAVRTSQSFEKAVSSNPFETICRTLERSAADNNLPIEFFTRVIRQGE